MTGGIQAASLDRNADPVSSRAGLKAGLAEAVSERDAAFAERNEAVAALAVSQGRVSELERRLGMNSRDSHKPQPSGGLSRPGPKEMPSSSRRSSGRRPGGQPGHKGATMRLAGTMSDGYVLRYHGHSAGRARDNIAPGSPGGLRLGGEGRRQECS